MPNLPGDTKGERQGGREQMDRFTGHLVQHGMKPEQARELARKEAIKHDDGRGVRGR